MKKSGERFLTRAQVASLLTVAQRTVDRLIAAGQFTRRKIGARTIIPESEVLAYVERSKLEYRR